MKKIIATVLSILTLGTVAFSMTACGEKKEDKKYDKSVVLGFDCEFPPYGYEKDGEYVGFDIEYAKKVCEELNYKLTLTPIDWDAKDSLIESGAIDFIWNGFTYEGREDDYTWSVQYMNNSIVILTTSAEIKSVADLAGKTVGVQTDSSGETALQENAELVATFKDGEYKTIPDYNTACTNMIAGAYDAIVVDYGVAKYLQGKTTSQTLYIAETPVTSETYAVGFKKGNTELAKAISDKMVEVAKDATFIQGLCTKYEIDYNSFLLK